MSNGERIHPLVEGVCALCSNFLALWTRYTLWMRNTLCRHENKEGEGDRMQGYISSIDWSTIFILCIPMKDTQAMGAIALDLWHLLELGTQYSPTA